MLMHKRLLFVICLTVKLLKISSVTEGHFMELKYESISINFNRNTFTEFYECLCSDVINTCQTTSYPFHYFPTIPSSQGNPYIANVDVTENTTKAAGSTSLPMSCSVAVTKSEFYIHYYVNITCARAMSPAGTISRLYSPNSGTCSKETLDVVWDAIVTAVFPTAQTTSAVNVTEVTTHTSNTTGGKTDTTRQTTHISTSASDKTDTTKQTTPISTPVTDKTDTTKQTTHISNPVSDKTDTTKQTTHISTPVSDNTDTTKQTTSISTSVSDKTDTTKQTTHISSSVSDKTDTTKQTTSISTSVSDKTDTTKQTTHISTSVTDKTDTTKQTTSISTSVSDKTDTTKQTTHISTSVTDKTDTTKQTTHISNPVSDKTDTTQQTTRISVDVSDTTMISTLDAISSSGGLLPTDSTTTHGPDPVQTTPDFVTTSNSTVISVIIGVIVGLTALMAILVSFCYVFRRRRNGQLARLKARLNRSHCC